jgi:EmrB/QacA subfamily drug resistance transporter
MPRVSHPTVVVLSVALGVTIIGIDGTIVNVALPRLSEETSATLPVVQWVATAYFLALASITPTAAWAIGRVGAKRVFLIGVGFFALASALVALSWNIESLIALRVVQGLAGGLVQPAAMTLVLTGTPPQQRGRMMALFGLPAFVGPVLGPVLGGWLLDSFSWRWMFLINVPLAVISLGVGATLFPRSPGGGTTRLDVRGLMLLPPGIALIVLGTSAAQGSFLEPTSSIPTIAGVAFVAGFVAHAVRAPSPLLDVRLLRHRILGGGTAVLFLFLGGYSATLILIPLYWQVVRGQSATVAGLLIAPTALTGAIVAQFAGRLVDRVPPLRVVAFGIALTTTAYAALALQLTADVPFWRIVVTACGAAVGSAFTVMPTMTAATRSLPNTEIPAASTVIGVVGQISSAICIAVVSVVLATQFASRLHGLSDGGIDGLHHLPPGALAELAPQIAASVQTALWIPVALTSVAGIIAVITLRSAPVPHRPEQPVVAASLREGGDARG